MSRIVLAALAVAAGVLSAPVLAHHSAVQFDFQNTVNVKGIVKVVQFANPHAKIVLQVTDEKRGTRNIEFEGHSRNNMYRQGLRPEMMAVGDEITVRIAPMRDGSDGGYVTAFITADGKAIGNISRAD
jgi:rRNA maturation protein Rpf1